MAPGLSHRAPADESGQVAPSRTLRLDLALVDAGWARSRTHAQRMIAEGRVSVNGRTVSKPAQHITADDQIAVEELPGGEWASRGAHKLQGALTRARIDPAGLRCADIGAAHGGFTDVLLRAGAQRVFAVDVGHDQLVAHVREDSRVVVLDGTSARDLSPQLLGGTVHLLVCDVSFISLTTIVAPLVSIVEPGGELLVMVKPQFEVGREALPKGGVVTAPAERIRAVTEVAAAFASRQCELRAVITSPLPGQDGNREYFVHMRRTIHTSALGEVDYDMIRSEVQTP